MSSSVTPNADQVYADVGAFIAAQLGLVVGITVVQGFQNRVAMPTPPTTGFVQMTVLNKKRLGTNHISWQNPDPTADPPIPFPTDIQYQQNQMWTMQLDCYGPQASEWADILTTLLRSEVACDALTTGQPLYADDPRRLPLANGEDQYEDRWMVTLQMQVNSVVSTPQDFADTLTLTLIEVDATYPP